MRARRPEPEAPSGEEILEKLFERYRAPLRRYGRFVLLGLAAVIVALLAYGQRNAKARSEQVQSWQGLGDLPPADLLSFDPERSAQLRRQVIERCNRMLKDRWETDATPWIMLKLGNAQQSAGLHKEALETYRKLKDRFPDHLAATLAERDRVAALEEMGRYVQAARACEALAAKHGEDLRFWLDAGRCWELAGNTQAALGAYEKLCGMPDKAHQEDLEMAAARLKRLRRDQPALLALPPAPAHPETTKVDTPIYPAEASESPGGEAELAGPPPAGTSGEPPAPAERVQQEPQDSPE